VLVVELAERQRAKVPVRVAHLGQPVNLRVTFRTNDTNIVKAFRADGSIVEVMQLEEPAGAAGTLSAIPSAAPLASETG